MCRSVSNNYNKKFKLKNNSSKHTAKPFKKKNSKLKNFSTKFNKFVRFYIKLSFFLLPLLLFVIIRVIQIRSSLSTYYVKIYEIERSKSKNYNERLRIMNVV